MSVLGRRSLALLAAVAVVSAAVASGVTYLLVGRDSGAHKPLPPVALTGVLRDTAGKPVAGASVQLTPLDIHAKAGQVIPRVLLASARTDSAGRFTIRQPQSIPIIRRLAAENSGFVNFRVMISKGRAFSTWTVPRKISHHAWFADGFGTPAASKVERITYRPFLGGSP